MKFDRVKFTGLRVTKNISQSEIAKKLGVSRPTIAGWEDGKVVPRISQVNDAAEILGVPAEELVIKA